MENAVEILI